MNKKLKVKNINYMGILIFCIFMFPFVFMGISSFTGYVIGVIFTFCIYSIITIAIVKYIKINENKFDLEADEETVTFKKYGSFNWNKINKIETRIEMDYSFSSSFKRRLFLKIYLTNGNILSIDTSNFDIHGTELALELKKLGKL